MSGNDTTINVKDILKSTYTSLGETLSTNRDPFEIKNAPKTTENGKSEAMDAYWAQFLAIKEMMTAYRNLVINDYIDLKQIREDFDQADADSERTLRAINT